MPKALSHDLEHTWMMVEYDVLLNVETEAGRFVQDNKVPTSLHRLGHGQVMEWAPIKIDQGLIGRMLFSDKSARIVHSAIRMAHELDIDTVAEGVETQAQLRFLLEAGCGKVQGYLISRPLPLAGRDTCGRGAARHRGPDR